MLERLVDGLWRIDLGNVNAYLVTVENGLLVVDTGMPGSHERILDAVQEAGHAPEAIRGFLITHTDLDHVGGLDALLEAHAAPVYLSQTASDLLTGVAKPPWLSTKGAFQRLTSPWLDRPSAERFHVVDDGDVVEGFTAIATPGHALGHLAFVDGERGICLIGDLVRTENQTPALPPGVINYDTAQARESLQHLLQHGPGFKIVCAGHGEPILADGYAALKQLLA